MFKVVFTSQFRVRILRSRGGQIIRPDPIRKISSSDRIGWSTKPDRVKLSQRDWIMIGSGETRLGWDKKKLGQKLQIYTYNITQTHTWHTHISHEYMHWISNSHSHRNRIQITVQSTDSRIYSNSHFTKYSVFTATKQFRNSVNSLQTIQYSPQQKLQNNSIIHQENNTSKAIKQSNK